MFNTFFFQKLLFGGVYNYEEVIRWTAPKMIGEVPNEFMTTKMYNGDKQTVLKAVQRRDTDATVQGLLWSYSTKDQKASL